MPGIALYGLSASLPHWLLLVVAVLGLWLAVAIAVRTAETLLDRMGW